MVEKAKKRFRMPRSNIFQMSIDGDIPNEFHDRFDHVLGVLTMHVVQNPRQAFKNIYQILKPGGWTFLTFFERTPIDDVLDKISKNPKWSNYGQDEMMSKYYYSDNPEKEYKKDIDAANFKDYKFNIEKDTYEFGSMEELKNLFTAVNAMIPKIPKELLDEYMAYYLKECQNGKFVDITTNKDGKQRACLHTKTYILHATKPQNINT